MIDRQQEQFHRFLQEIRRLNRLEAQPAIAGEVSFYILGTLPREGSPMMPELKETLNNIGPLLRQADYEIQITVWATTPSQTAWTRSVQQAEQIKNETIRYLRLTADQQTRLTAVGRSWISSDIKRPAASVTLRRVARTAR